MTDGPLDERCTDCGALVDACRCLDDVWDEERYLNGDDFAEVPCSCIGLSHRDDCPNWTLPY